jgi:hypothetical protein
MSSSITTLLPIGVQCISIYMALLFCFNCFLLQFFLVSDFGFYYSLCQRCYYIQYNHKRDAITSYIKVRRPEGVPKLSKRKTKQQRYLSQSGEHLGIQTKWRLGIWNFFLTVNSRSSAFAFIEGGKSPNIYKLPTRAAAGHRCYASTLLGI